MDFMPIKCLKSKQACDTEGFEVGQGRRGREIPSGLGPSLGSTIKQGICGPGKRAMARYRAPVFLAMI